MNMNSWERIMRRSDQEGRCCLDSIIQKKIVVHPRTRVQQDTSPASSLIDHLGGVRLMFCFKRNSITTVPHHVFLTRPAFSRKLDHEYSKRVGTHLHWEKSTAARNQSLCIFFAF